MNKPKRVLFVLFVGLFWVAACPKAEAVVLDVLSDAYLQDEPRDGIADSIVNTNALILERSADFDSKPVMVFDLTPYGGLALNSATLSGYGTTSLFGLNPSAGSLNAGIISYSATNSILSSEFSQPGNAAGTAVIPNAGGDFSNFKLDFFESNVTTAVQQLLDAGASYGHFRLEASGDQFFAYINAGEATAPFSTVDERFAGPRLSLNFAESNNNPVAPEPATFFLIVFGGSALGLTHRHRKTACC